MTEQGYLETFEKTIHDSIYNYLLRHDAVDRMLPEAPDIEDKWVEICNSYLEDGVREFGQYPMASLGWMMFVGMAVANMWDEDWVKHSQHADLFKMIRDVRGFDHLDEHVCETVLGLSDTDVQSTFKLVANTTSMVYSMLRRGGFEPSTGEAFEAYTRCLHQLYYFGAAIELKRLGYHMTEVSHSDLWGKMSLN